MLRLHRHCLACQRAQASKSDHNMRKVKWMPLAALFAFAISGCASKPDLKFCTDLGEIGYCERWISGEREVLSCDQWEKMKNESVICPLDGCFKQLKRWAK
jgi:hypothetical protein